MTPVSLWRHKSVVMHVTSKTIDIFSIMRDSSPTASENSLPISASWCIETNLFMSRSDLNVIYRASWGRGPEGASRFSQCTRLVTPNAMTYPRGPSTPCLNRYYNTRPTEKSPVRQQNAWFDRKKPGSTEKCPVRQKNALPRMHQLTLPLSNIPPPPSSEKYFFPIFFPYFFKNQ